jgi:hypothetical protein
VNQSGGQDCSACRLAASRQLKSAPNRAQSYFMVIHSRLRTPEDGNCSGLVVVWVLIIVIDQPFQKGEKMKYVISWFERPQGSPIEYENAQKRILEVFGQWKAPANFRIEFFVIRVGEWGGHMLMECDDPVTIHKFCSMLPAFVFQVHPVIPVEDAVRGELEVIAWRDGLKSK